MKRTPWLVLLGLFVALAASAGPVEGQIWKKVKEKAKQKIEQKVEAATDTVVDGTYDKASGAVKCVVSDKACIKKAKDAGQQVVVTNPQGQVLADQSAAGGNAAAAQGAAAEKAAPSSPNPGEGAWANYDFVPGERVIWKEDFANERVGNFPG